MPAINFSPVNSYMYNMLYSGSAASRTRSIAQQTDDFLNLVTPSIGYSGQQYKADQQAYQKQIAGFTAAAKGLKSAAEVFTGKDNVCKQKVVTDSSSAMAGSATSAAKSAVYDLSVEQLAAAQRNDGTSVSSDGYGILVQGTYTVGITVGNGQEKQINVTIANTDSNKQVLTKLAAAINAGGSEVKAEVKTVKNTSFLSMESKNTGMGNGFTIRDISNNMAASLQLSNIAQQGRDAVYTVNGVTKAAAGNQVKVDNGNVTLTLQAVTAGTDKVTVNSDSTKVIKAVRDVAAAYNEINYNTHTASNITSMGEKMLKGIQTQFTGAKRADYQKIGLTIDSRSGALTVDSNVLTKALAEQPEKVEKLLTGAGGLGAAAGQTAKSALSIPAASYFKAPNVNNYINYGANLFGSSAAQSFSMYSQGLLLDLLV